VNWQPVETAPEDTDILCFSAGSMYVAYFDSDFQEWYAKIEGDLVDCGEELTHPAPVYWMPLPEPPK
jgi:hypothetical protein